MWSSRSILWGAKWSEWADCLWSKGTQSSLCAGEKRVSSSTSLNMPPHVALAHSFIQLMPIGLKDADACPRHSKSQCLFDIHTLLWPSRALKFAKESFHSLYTCFRPLPFLQYHEPLWRETQWKQVQWSLFIVFFFLLHKNWKPEKYSRDGHI